MYTFLEQILVGDNFDGTACFKVFWDNHWSSRLTKTTYGEAKVCFVFKENCSLSIELFRTLELGR